MSEQSSSEPTMEEILASIRRIISEDEQPAEDKAAEPAAEPEAPPPPPPPPAADPIPEPVAAAPAIEVPADDDDDDALELTQKVETHGDLDVLAPSEPEDVPEPPPPVAGHQAFWPDKGQKLVSDPTEEAAASAFGRLSASILMPAHGRTLEDVVRELLSPLLKQWLDDNLPRIVQTAVDEEVQRIARGGRPPGV